MLRYNGDSGEISAYLKDDRTMKTDDVADQWQKEMDNIANCTNRRIGIDFHELHGKTARL